MKRGEKEIMIIFIQDAVINAKKIRSIIRKKTVLNLTWMSGEGGTDQFKYDSEDEAKMELELIRYQINNQ